MEPVRLTFRYTERDFVRAYRLHFRHKLRLKTDIAVVTAVTLFGGFLWNSSGVRDYAIVMFCCSAILVGLLFTAFVIVPPRLYQREPKHRDEYSLVFASDRIQFHTIHIDSNIEWELYTHAIVDANSYNLYYGSSSLSIIPTRVFESSEQRNSFDQLISQKIPKISRKS